MAAVEPRTASIKDVASIASVSLRDRAQRPQPPGSVSPPHSRPRAERELPYLNRLEQQRVQGILITPIDPEASILDELPLRGTPVVIVDRTRSSAMNASPSSAARTRSDCCSNA